jgi:hypothetical protein
MGTGCPIERDTLSGCTTKRFLELLIVDGIPLRPVIRIAAHRPGGNNAPLLQPLCGARNGLFAKRVIIFLTLDAGNSYDWP